MADSRRLLLDLLDDLLVVAREAASETRSLGRLVADLSRLDFGKAKSAAVYLAERGFSGHAYRLTQDVERLRQKADEAFRGPFVASPTPDDRKQERRCLASLHSEAHGLLQFLNELKPLVDEDNDAVGGPVQPATGQGQTTTGGETPAGEGERRIAKAKRSTERGEARLKIIAALTAHHQYENGSCLNFEPSGVRPLARLLDGVSEGSVSGFFKSQFGSHADYRTACRDSVRLAQSLRILNGELTPRILSQPLSGDVEATV